MKKIVSVRPLDGYRLHIVFEDHSERDCDISPFLDTGAFRELKDKGLFDRAANATYSVEWPNGIDLSSDTLSNI